MLNKKILAVAVAASFSTSAFAAINLNTGANALPIATETYTAAAITVTDAALLDLDVIGGINVAPNTTVYVRFELTNATWGDTVADADLNVDAADATNETIALVAGGAVTDNYAVFSFVDTDTSLTTANIFTLATVDDLDITASGTSVSAAFKTYLGAEASTNSSNGIADTEFASTSSDIITFVTGRGTAQVAAPAAQVTALVADGFTTYDATNAATATTTLTNLGGLRLDIAAAISATAVDATTLAGVAAADVYDTDSVVTVAGIFSFGDWELNDNANCAGTARALTLNTEQTVGTAATANFTAAAWYLCNDLGTPATFDSATDVIPKVSTAYTLTLVDDALTGSLGTIGYDTTAISLDYITVNPDYAQKIFIINTSTSDASYTTTFTEEAGVSASGGSGTVLAQSMLTIKASDFMTIVGGLRASAVIEIEADATNISASTQIVNLDTKNTDTISLTVE
jgi:hypothetical protein